MPIRGGLEAALEETGQEVEAALRTASALIRELKKAKASTTAGQVRDLRRALSVASATTGELATASNVRWGPWTSMNRSTLHSREGD